MQRLRILCFTAAVSLLPQIAAAGIIQLDLNAFYSEPGSAVAIDPSGQSAVLSEDPASFITFLSNVPGLGDPSIILGGVGTSLVFDYEFSEPVGNTDIFHVALLDGLTGTSLDATLESYFDTTSAGRISFDLSAYSALSLGLQIELVADLLDADFTSTLRISNLHLVVPEPPVGVPEPGSLALMLMGVALLGLGRRPRSVASSRI